MRKLVLVACGVLVLLTAFPSAVHANGLAGGSVRCPARLPASLTPSGTDTLSSKRVSFRIPLDGASAAIAQLHRGLADEDREALLLAETYFSRAKSLANNYSIAASATMRLAQLNNDQALLTKARASLEKSLTRLRAADDWAKSLHLATARDLTEVKRMQAEAVGGDAGLALIREALSDNDRLLRGLSADADPEFFASRSLFAAGLRFELAVLSGDWTGVARATTEFEAGMSDLADPVERRDNQLGLAGMLIVTAQLQSRQDGLVMAQRARLMVTALIDQTKSSADLLARRAQLATLSGNLSGSWSTWTAAQRDPCAANARFAIMLAEADLILAADEAALQDARRRLREADDKLADAPAYQRQPGVVITLAESLMASSIKTTGSQSRDLRSQAKAALDQAEQRASKCFCAFYQARITKLRAQLDHTTL